MSEIKHIAGVLALTNPLHVASPDAHHVAKDATTGKYSSPRPGGLQKGTAGFACTAVQTMRVAISDSEMQDRAEEGAGQKRNCEDVPFVPANSIRGRLRRAGCDVVHEVLRTRGEKVSLGVWHGMMCGAVTGQPNKKLTFDYIQQASRHPFLGLFGGGPGLVPSSLRLSTAWPIVSATVDNGMVPAKFADGSLVGNYQNTFLLRQVLFSKRIDDALVFQGMDSMAGIVEDHANAVVEWAKSVESKTDENGEAGPREKAKLETFGAYEVVVAGTRLFLPLEVDLAHIGLSGYGLFLLALSGFCKKQGRHLGGLARHGFGTYIANFTDDSGERVLTDACEPNPANDSVMEAIKEWDAVKGSLTAAELEYLYALDTKEPKEKKPKADKKASPEKGHKQEGAADSTEASE